MLKRLTFLSILLLTLSTSAFAQNVGSVQSFSHIWFGLSGARHWLKR